MARSKQLTMRALLERIEPVFAKADECVRHLNSIRYPMRDLLFPGLAIFTTKMPSLRRFERDLHGEPRLAENLRRLYKVGGLPTDEAIRQRLDRLDPKQLEDGYRMLFRQAGRHGNLPFRQGALPDLPDPDHPQGRHALCPSDGAGSDRASGLAAGSGADHAGIRQQGG